MTTYDEAVSAVKGVMGGKEDRIPWQIGYLGDGTGSDAAVRTARENYYWVRYPFQNSPAVPVYCVNNIPLVPGIRVKVGYLPWEPGVFQIITSSDQRLNSNDSTTGGDTENPAPPGSYANVLPHMVNHMYLNIDQVAINWRQITPLGVFPTSPASLSVNIYSGYIPRPGTDIFVTAQTVDLTASVPVSGARYALISYDSTGAVVVTDGTVNPGGFGALTAADIPDTPAGNWRSAAVVLYVSQTAIVETRNEIDIYDLRFPEETTAGSVTPGQIGGATAQYQYIVSGASPFTPVWSSGFLNITAAKTLAVTNGLTLAGTDGKTLTLTGSLTVGADATLNGGGTIALGGFTLTVPKTGTVPVGTGTATRLAEWVTDANTLQASTLIKTGAGVLTLDAGGAYTLTIAGTGTAVTGTGTAGQVTYWNGTNGVTGHTGLVYDGAGGLRANSTIHVGSALSHMTILDSSIQPADSTTLVLYGGAGGGGSVEFQGGDDPGASFGGSANLVGGDSAAGTGGSLNISVGNGVMPGAINVFAPGSKGIGLNRISITVPFLVAPYSIALPEENGTFALLEDILDSNVGFSDITTGNVTTSAHGFVPKLSGAASQYFGGDGVYHDIPTTLSLFLDHAASGIAGYLSLITTVPTGVEQTAAASCPGADTVIEEFALAAGVFDFISAQTLHIHLHLAKTAGTKTATTRSKVYHRTSGGTETLLGTSSTTGNLTGSNAPYDLDVSVADTNFAATDRLVIKVLGTPGGAGTDPTVTIYYEGDTNARIEVGAQAAGGASAPHDILSATHSDTLADTVVAGDVIIGNATPKWSRLAAGAQYKVLTMGASLPAWSGYLLDGTTGGKTVLNVTNTKVLTLTSADTYTLTVAGTASISGTNTGDQSLTGLVPYTGATTDLDLGANDLFSSTAEFGAGADQIRVVVAGVYGTLTWVPATTNKTITLPNLTGTVPLGTGTSTRIAEWSGTNTIQASTLIKSGAGVLTLSAASAYTATVTGTTSISGTNTGDQDLSGYRLISTGYVFVPLAAFNLKDTGAVSWNNVQKNTGTYTFDVDTGQTTTIPAGVKAVVLGMDMKWPSASDGTYFYTRCHGETVGQAAHRSLVANFTMNVSPFIQTVDANAQFDVIIAGANNTSGSCICMGYFI